MGGRASKVLEEGVVNGGNSGEEHAELQPQRQRTRKQHEVMRLAKRIARSGKSSRREAERLIQEGRVKPRRYLYHLQLLLSLINGAVALSPAVNVSTADRVRVDGKELSTHIAPARVWAVHKARGELVARSDEKGRRCVLERVKAVGLSDALKPVGRLDFMTEGLLLLTDDGDLARKLEHPTVGLRREYRVRVFGSVTAEKLRTMQRGCVIEGVHYKGMVVNIDRGEKHNTWLVVHCVEGKNNQIRRVCQHLNLTVNRLIRTAFGPFKLGKMASGGVAEVPLHEQFLKQVNTAMETGVPVPAPRAADPRSVRAAALTGRRRAGLARAKAVPPRPSPTKGGAAAGATAQGAAAKWGVRVKRGRGGGVTVRAPKADAEEPVREARKRKKANKVLAWKLRAKARDARQRRRAPAAAAPAAARPGVRRAAAAPARPGSRRAASAARGGGVRRAATAGAGVKRGGSRSKAQSGAGCRQ
ncbi:pseudouridine synthase [Tribonema minus]|uniref:Pseudouridine synthase n=1 Tax=Tribonema minus TaxID=303371 RepID=A0A835ZDT5_9STRA|nr:pseudouridine synthase [Tribonema minus]